jgi:hypothetical protein
MKIKRSLHLAIAAMLLAVLWAGCETEPCYEVKSETAYANFFLASDVMKQRNYVHIYINDSVPDETYAHYPSMNAIDMGYVEFPATMAGRTNKDVVGWTRNTQGYVFYQPLEPGVQKIIFTNGTAIRTDRGPDTRIFLKDSLLNLTPGSYTNVYLADDVENNTFRIVTTKEDRNMPVEKGKTLLRIINLCPDAGPLLISRVYDNGHTEEVEGFPSVLPFGQYTAYTSFSTEGLEPELNSLVFAIASARNPYVQLLTAVVPAIEGAMHTLVIHGFQHPTTRGIINGYDPYVGLPLYRNYEVGPSLTTTLRRSR